MGPQQGLHDPNVPLACQRQGRATVLRSVKWQGDVTHEVGHRGTFIGSRISGSSLLLPRFLSGSASPTLVQG